MYFAYSIAHSAALFVHSRTPTVTMLYYHLVSSMMPHEINNHPVPSNISVVFTHSEKVHHNFTRFSAPGNLYVKASRTNQLLFFFARMGVRVRNSISMKLHAKKITLFKRELKNQLLKLMEIEEMNVDLCCTEICKYPLYASLILSNFSRKLNFSSNLFILNFTHVSCFNCVS